MGRPRPLALGLPAVALASLASVAGLATLPVRPGAAAQEAVTRRVLDFAPPRVLDLVSRITDTGGEVTGLAVQESPTAVEIALAADLLFAFDSAELTPAAQEKLGEVAAIIRQKAQGRVRIDGYTDSVGDERYNQGLSERRAQAVRTALAAMPGLEQTEFVVQGHGEADPVAPNQRPGGADDPEGRQRNRRVTVSFDKRS